MTTPTERLLDLESQQRSIGTSYQLTFVKRLTLKTLFRFPEQYDNFSLLGVGGFGEVYTAVYNEEKVAIKRIREPDETFPPEREVEALLRIRQAAGDACIPSVVCLIDAFYSPRMPLMKVSMDEAIQPFIVTEFIQGQTLAENIDAGEMQYVQWFRQGLAALQFLHLSAKVIHRDVRGPNLLIRDSNRNVVIIDVGAACFVDSLSECSTDAALAVGEPDYGSFKRHLAYGSDIELTREDWYADDVWGLAMTILKAYSGQIPFVANRRGVLTWDVIEEGLKKQPRDIRPIERFNEKLTTLLPKKGLLRKLLRQTLLLVLAPDGLRRPPTPNEFRRMV